MFWFKFIVIYIFATFSLLANFELIGELSGNVCSISYEVLSNTCGPIDYSNSEENSYFQCHSAKDQGEDSNLCWAYSTESIVNFHNNLSDEGLIALFVDVMSLFRGYQMTGNSSNDAADPEELWKLMQDWELWCNENRAALSNNESLKNKSFPPMFYREKGEIRELPFMQKIERSKAVCHSLLKVGNSNFFNSKSMSYSEVVSSSDITDEIISVLKGGPSIVGIKNTFYSKEEQGSHALTLIGVMSCPFDNSKCCVKLRDSFAHNKYLEEDDLDEQIEEGISSKFVSINTLGDLYVDVEYFKKYLTSVFPFK